MSKTKKQKKAHRLLEQTTGIAKMIEVAKTRKKKIVTDSKKIKLRMK